MKGKAIREVTDPLFGAGCGWLRKSAAIVEYSQV
jgi:hypothetical protein